MEKQKNAFERTDLHCSHIFTHTRCQQVLNWKIQSRLDRLSCHGAAAGGNSTQYGFSTAPGYVSSTILNYDRNRQWAIVKHGFFTAPSCVSKLKPNYVS